MKSDDVLNGIALLCFIGVVILLVITLWQVSYMFMADGTMSV